MKTAYYLLLIGLTWSCIALAFFYGPEFIILAGVLILCLMYCLYREGVRDEQI